MFWRSSVYKEFNGFDLSLYNTMDYQMIVEFGLSQGQNTFRERPDRPEMKGPDNINSILNSLKKVNVDNDSTISAEEVDLMNTNATSRRKRRSDKNTISLAI
jgi:hypothetical protein